MPPTVERSSVEEHGAPAAARRALTDPDAVFRLFYGVAASLALLAIFTAVLIPLRDRLNEGTIALALVVPPLAAAGGGPVPAVAMAAIGALAFNFFFTRPYYSFAIDSSEAVAAFVVYLLVTVTLAILAGRLREARGLAERRAASATALGGLAVGLLGDEPIGPTLQHSLHDLVAMLHLRGAHLHVELADHPLDLFAGDVTRAAAGAVEDGHVVDLPVTAEARPGGNLVADAGDEPLDADRRRVLETFAGVVGIAAARSRTQREAAVRQAAEETNRMRRALLQSVSHDLRTPLTAIRALATTLDSAELDEAARHAMLVDIESEAGRLTRLVTSLLDLSRIEAGALEPARTAMPVEELLDGAVEAVGLSTGGRGIDVRVAAGLPTVAVDETMVRQVLVNLLENAARHDRGTSPIMLVARPSGDDVEIRVVDHGPGVSESERTRIFEPYLHLPGSGSQPGTGLGLAIARGFVEANDGSIVAEGTPGGGATFVVTLPGSGGR
jgi:two-component system, OmpR family, sensor histidine kinase KdpD